MKKIEVDYTDDPGDQYVTLWQDGGVIRQEDGSIKLWYRPF